MNNIQRKWKKQIGRDSWMVKLQQLCFGESTPEFIGYCPFFWFTWLCLVASPVILPVRGIIFLIALAVSALPDNPPRGKRRPRDYDLAEFYGRYLEKGMSWMENNWSLRSCYLDILNWIGETPDWENCAKAAVLREVERAKWEEVRKKNAQRRANFLRKLSSVLAPVFKFLLISAGLLLTGVALRLIYIALSQISLHALFYALKWIGCGVGIAVLLVLLSEFVIFPIWRRRRKCPKNPGKLGVFKRMVWSFANGLDNALGFLGDTVEAIYTRECPLIEWGDETRPITRNGE